MVGFPPKSRLKTMEWTQNPTDFTDIGGKPENLGAKSETWREATCGLLGANDDWVPINGIKEDESGKTPWGRKLD